MKREIILSIKPKHLFNILNGIKTLELRKSVPKDYKGWVYIYCTKGKPYLTEVCKDEYWNTKYELFNIPHFGDIDLNGKVVARFWFDEYAEIKLNVYTSLSTTYFESFYSGDNEPYEEQSGVIDSNYLENITQVSFSDMKTYAKGKTLYAWHIKQLEIFDTPLSLNDFYNPNLWMTYEQIKEYEKETNDFIGCRIKKAPKRYQFVYRKDE